MRIITALIAITVPVMAAGQVQARECVGSSPDVLSVTQWSAEEFQATIGKGVSLEVTIENKTENDLRMVDARIFFDDVLGRSITNLVVEEDARIAAGERFVQSGRYQSYGMTDIGRLATVETSDIVTTICTTAAVASDGEVLRFD